MDTAPRTITQARPAWEPPTQGVRSRWLLVVAGLLLTAVAAAAVRPVCHVDTAGARESGFGVRHEQRGQSWYHCEPWIAQAFSD